MRKILIITILMASLIWSATARQNLIRVEYTDTIMSMAMSDSSQVQPDKEKRFIIRHFNYCLKGAAVEYPGYQPQRILDSTYETCFIYATYLQEAIKKAKPECAEIWPSHIYGETCPEEKFKEIENRLLQNLADYNF